MLVFIDIPQSSKPKWKKRYHMLTQQDLLVSELKEIMTTICLSKEDRPKRVSLKLVERIK